MPPILGPILVGRTDLGFDPWPSGRIDGRGEEGQEEGSPGDILGWRGSCAEPAAPGRRGRLGFVGFWFFPPPRMLLWNGWTSEMGQRHGDFSVIPFSWCFLFCFSLGGDPFWVFMVALLDREFLLCWKYQPRRLADRRTNLPEVRSKHGSLRDVACDNFSNDKVTFLGASPSI